MNKLNISHYIGGKNFMVDAINEQIDLKKKKYYELYGGMANVLLNKPMHDQEFYNDFDKQIAHLVYVLSQEGELLLYKMLESRYSEDEFKQALEISKGFNGYVDSNRDVSDEDIRVARATWITLLQSRNGMRRNWKGMKIGNEEAIYLNKLVNKYELATRLRNVTVTNRDALEILKEIKNDEDAMIYLDPPYTFHERTSKNLYQCEQDDDKQQEMVELIKDAKASILVSGYKNSIYDEVLNESNGWTSMLLMNTYKHSSSRRGIKPMVEEWIWKNY